ncbi:unnamed protein product [Meganyctiphanes norvegica]|uniref:Elongation of very long chain fatty acids protein n=1 Tax=Meganyctiphanes norvegica TaxID=48144 RepID=A0AAV2PNS5_MEGNR
MADLLNKIIYTYKDVFEGQRDPRVDDWFMMSSPFPSLITCLTYVFIVKVAGPYYMKNRPPVNMRNILVAYNAFQVIFSAWIFYELGMGGWFTTYSYRCQPVDYSNSPQGIRMANAAWWYYFSKFTEFFDTFFFILRKKFEHVSTLHVIHHGCMPMSVWFGVKFTPGGHSTFFGLLNSLVHIVMYLYYMLAAMGPEYHRYIWWKKYLTNLQMVQFVLIFSHAFQLGFTECEYPRAFMWWIGGHAFMFFALFSDFYIKAYFKKSKQKESSKANGHANGFLTNEAKYANGNCNGVTNGFTNSISNICFLNNGITNSLSDKANQQINNDLNNSPYIYNHKKIA